MRTLALVCAVAAASLAATSLPAGAQSANRTIDKVRIGISAHNLGGREKNSYDLNAEAITGKLGDPTNPAIPGLHLGTNLNTSGKTSMIYGGATWTAPVNGQVYVEGDLGLALHNGKSDDSGRVNLGDCHVAFRGQALVGYQINPQWDVSLGVEHVNALGICNGGTAGTTNIGTKLGYRF